MSRTFCSRARPRAAKVNRDAGKHTSVDRNTPDAVTMFRNALATLRTAAADAVAAQKRCYATDLANIGPAKGSSRTVS